MTVRPMMRTRALGVLAVALSIPYQAGAQGTVSGTLLLGRETVASAVVQLIPIGPRENPRADTALIDQSHLRFNPGVVPVQVGSTVEFLNSDPIMHNVFSPGRTDSAFDLGTYPMGQSRFRTFNQEGSYVILCHVHPEMVAWVVVSPTSFAGVTRRDGGFVVESVPPGAYEVRIWHRRWTRDAGTVDVPSRGISRWTLRVSLGGGEDGR